MDVVNARTNKPLMTRGYCEICDEEGINGGLSDDVVPSENHLNGTVCRKHADTAHGSSKQSKKISKRIC